MYQRDICSLSYQRHQRLDDRAERRIKAEKKDAQHNSHDDDHNRGHHRFAARRPDNFRRLGAHLPDEFAWGRLCHGVSVPNLFADSRPAPVRLVSRIVTIAKPSA